MAENGVQAAEAEPQWEPGGGVTCAYCKNSSATHVLVAWPFGLPGMDRRITNLVCPTCGDFAMKCAADWNPQLILPLGAGTFVPRAEVEAEKRQARAEALREAAQIAVHHAKRLDEAAQNPKNLVAAASRHKADTASCIAGWLQDRAAEVEAAGTTAAQADAEGGEQ